MKVMFSEKELTEITERAIEATEKPGYRKGGSDHMQHISYSIDEITARSLEDEKTEISFRYTLHVETEFTIFPDNPPMEYHRRGSIVLDKDKNIVTQAGPLP